MKKIVIALTLACSLAFLAVMFGNGGVAALHYSLLPKIKAFLDFVFPHVPVVAMLLGIGIVGFARS
ncbi:uncharacterized protein Dvar_53360 [Desulfosarcina variabilis str. Montpellier]|uniref:hypothetical protein n=1 Tax=Desulfosarcina variabilis TaxID=2300 RepID=UPI003AFA38C9